MSSRKSIIYVHHAKGYSGAMRSLFFLLERIDRSRFDAKIYCTYSGPAMEIFKKLGIPVLKTRKATTFHGSTITKNTFFLFLNRILHLPITATEAFFLIKKEKPDVLHLNSTCLFPFAIGAKLARAKTKVVMHVREPVAEGFYGWPLRFFTKVFSDHIVAICNNDLKSLRIKKNKPSSVVYNFVDFHEYSSLLKGTLRSELGIAEDEFLCLYLARFDEANGSPNLISWAKQISSSHPEIHFVFAGGETADKSDMPNLHFLGFRHDVPNIIASSDINICPFTQPHFARSIIEAAAMGKPSIGNNIGGVDELIVDGETGFLFDNSKKSLLEKIIQLQMKDLYSTFSQNCLSFAKQNFDIENNSHKTFEIYTELLRNE